MAKPSESKSSPNLTSLSNVVKETDEDNSVIVKTNGLTNLPTRAGRQSSLMASEKQSPLIDGRIGQLDEISDNQRTRINGQSNNLAGSLTKSLNSQALGNFRERSSESMKVGKKSDGQQRDRTKRTSELKDRLNSLGTWFRTRDDRNEGSSRSSSRKHKKEDIETDNEIALPVGLASTVQTNNGDQVDTRTTQSSLAKVDVERDEKCFASKSDARRTIGTNQAKDNFSVIHQKVGISDTPDASNRVTKQGREQYRNDQYGRQSAGQRRQNASEAEDDIELAGLAVHGPDQSKNREEEEKRNGCLTSPYCTYKITAECTSSGIDSRKSSDADQFKEEEFTIKIQLSEPR